MQLNCNALGRAATERSGGSVHRHAILWPGVVALVATALLAACGGSKTPAPSSTSPIVSYGGVLSTVTPTAGAQKGRTLPGGTLIVHVSAGTLRFVVSTYTKHATFTCQLYNRPQLNLEPVPIRITVKATHGLKSYDVQPTKALPPGPYFFRYGGRGRFTLALYEPGANQE